VSGFACRNPRGFWAAEFDLLASPQSPVLAPEEIERLASTTAARPALAPIGLHRYALVRPTGSALLLLDVEAPDQVGFLAQLLAHLAFLSLFPGEVWIATSGGAARVRLHLRAVAGTEAVEQARVAVRRERERLVTMHAHNTPSAVTWTP
jgi:hypothetical protein